jgi:3-dehydroquinate dehydratase-1
MIKIGRVQLGRVPRVVLGVDGESPAVAHAVEAGVDVLEFRVDQFSGSLTSSGVAEEAKVLKRHQLPLIGTIRSHQERGRARLSEHQRAALYEALSPVVDAIDIDLRAAIVLRVVASARRNKNVVLLSHHDFHATPPESALKRIVSRATDLGADIIKIATFAKHEEDVMRLLRFTWAHRPKHLVTTAMGPIGTVSRLVFPLVGSLMTYTNVVPSDGQIPATRLIEHLRVYYPRYHEELIARLGV